MQDDDIDVLPLREPPCRGTPPSAPGAAPRGPSDDPSSASWPDRAPEAYASLATDTDSAAFLWVEPGTRTEEAGWLWEGEGEHRFGVQIDHRRLSRANRDGVFETFGARAAAWVGLFFDNGGHRLHLVRVRYHDAGAPLHPLVASALRAHRMALDTLDACAGEQVSLLALPALWDLPGPEGAAVAAEIAAAAAERPGRLLLLDDGGPDHHGPGPALVSALRMRLVGDLELQRSVAVYGPWLELPRGRLCPPSVAVAGLIAAHDLRWAPFGVRRAPANLVLKGVAALAPPSPMPMDPCTNTIVQRPDRGLVLWGATTFDPDVPIHQRRTLGAMRRIFDTSLQVHLFEAAGASLDAALRRTATRVCRRLWDLSVLAGSSPEEAFEVRTLPKSSVAALPGVEVRLRLPDCVEWFDMRFSFTSLE